MPKPAGPHSLRLDRASVRPERASARNNGCPTSHLARTLGTALLVPCMPHPRRTARAPHDPCPQSWRGPGSLLVSPGLRELVGDAPRPLTCRELAVGRPQKRPRGEEQERHKSRQRRRRRIHAEFGRSFKQLCKELPGGSPRNPRRRRGPGLAGWGRGEDSRPPALFPSSRSPNYLWGESVASVAGRPRRQLSMLGGGCSC